MTEAFIDLWAIGTSAAGPWVLTDERNGRLVRWLRQLTSA
jgi:hypothetical protein